MIPVGFLAWPWTRRIRSQPIRDYGCFGFDEVVAHRHCGYGALLHFNIRFIDLVNLLVILERPKEVPRVF